MANSLTVKTDLSGAMAGLDAIVEASNKAVRPAAQAGAQVLYDEVLMRVPVAAKVKTKKGGRKILPGALKAAIYQAFSKDNSGTDHATYHVSWNYKKAPHGHLVEFGTSTAPAHPFLRPSFDAVGDRAVRLSESVYTHHMQGALT